MDGAVVCVPGCPLAAQGCKADGQTHQCYRDANPRNHIDQKLFYTNPKLWQWRKTHRQLSAKRFIKIFLFTWSHRAYVWMYEHELMQVCELMWMYFVTETPVCIFASGCVSSCQMNNHTQQKEHLKKKHLIQFSGRTKHPAAFNTHTLSFSRFYNPQLSLPLCLIFKQHFVEHSGDEEGGWFTKVWHLAIWQ